MAVTSITNAGRALEIKAFVLCVPTPRVPGAWTVPWNLREFDSGRTYGQLYSYTIEMADLYEDDIPPEILIMAGEHIQWLIPRGFRRDIVLTHLPANRSRLDNLGYFGWMFHGSRRESLEQYRDDRYIMRMVNRG